MKHKYFSGLSKNTFLLALTSLFADISTEMLYPILPIFLTQILGAGGAVVGIVEGVAVAMQNIIQGISGALSDKIQKRKPIAIFGYALAAVSKPFIGISTSWWGVFAARSADRLGSGTRSAPRDAMVANSVSDANRGKAFGLEGIGDNLGAFFGPLLTVVLLFYFNFPLRSIFYLAIIPGLIALIMIFLVKDKPSHYSAKAKIDLQLFKFPPEYWKYLGITAVFGIGNISSSFFILQMKNSGVSLILTILTYAFFNLVAAITSYPAGFLSDRFGRKNLLIFAFAVFLFVLIGFSGSKNFAIIFLLFIFYGAYQGIFRAVGKAFATDFAPSTLRAGAIGWYNTVIGLSGLAASIAAGQIYDRFGSVYVFIAAIAPVFLGTFLLLFFVKNVRS